MRRKGEGREGKGERKGRGEVEMGDGRMARGGRCGVSCKRKMGTLAILLSSQTANFLLVC
jgi:hypothetical protein